MMVSNWIDRFANVAVIGVLLAGLPLAAISFIAHSL
jgi:hypothetical protein